MNKQYVICQYNHSSIGYYYAKEANSLDLRLLADSLMYLKNNIEIEMQDLNNPTFEDYRKVLINTCSLDAGDSSWFSTQIQLNKKNNTVSGNSDFTADSTHPLYYSESYLDMNKEKIQGYSYHMHLENFLRILKKYLAFYDLKIEFIIMYREDKDEFYCEEYKPTKEQLEKWGE